MGRGTIDMSSFADVVSCHVDGGGLGGTLWLDVWFEVGGEKEWLEWIEYFNAPPFVLFSKLSNFKTCV